MEQSISLDAEDEGSLRSTVQAEIPFIPSAQRTNNANTTVLVEDTIVVVGQARQKKRKRVKIIPNPGENNPKGGGGDTVPFDFASAPNILDAAPSTEQSSIPRKKVKQAKGMVHHCLYSLETEFSYNFSRSQLALWRISCPS